MTGREPAACAAPESEAAAAPPALPDPARSGVAVAVVRHGQTGDNLPPYRFQGRTDTPLNEAGRRQARELAEGARGMGYRALWTSDLSRACDTAAALAEVLGLEARVEPRLSESHRGRWEGRLMEEVEREDPELFGAWRATDPSFRFPGGESLTQHRDRVREAIAAILAGPLPAVAVAHGGTIRCLALSDLAMFHAIHVPNCGVLPLDRDGRLLQTRR